MCVCTSLALCVMFLVPRILVPRILRSARRPSTTRRSSSSLHCTYIYICMHGHRDAYIISEQDHGRGSGLYHAWQKLYVYISVCVYIYIYILYYWHLCGSHYLGVLRSTRPRSKARSSSSRSLSSAEHVRDAARRPMSSSWRSSSVIGTSEGRLHTYIYVHACMHA